MVNNNQLERIKAGIKKNIGNRVKLTLKNGRKTSTIKKGVIESIYPSIFIVKLDPGSEREKAERRVSYSYTDILTKNIELVLCRNTAPQAANN